MQTYPIHCDESKLNSHLRNVAGLASMNRSIAMNTFCEQADKTSIFSEQFVAPKGSAMSVEHCYHGDDKTNEVIHSTTVIVAE